MLKYRPLNLQFFAEGGDGGSGGEPPQTVKIGDQEYSVSDLQTKLSDYSKLEKKMTQVSQENSELRKTADMAKEWINFDQAIRSLPEAQQQQFIKQTNDFFAAVQAGTVAQKDVSGINKAIAAAEKAGDTKTADKLTDARDEALSTVWLNEQFEDLEEQAEADGIDFKKREFKKFLTQYLEDEGYGEDDDFDERDVKRAYKLYRAEKKDKANDDKQKQNLPNVGTGGSGVGVGGKDNKTTAPKNLKEAMAVAKKMLGG